LSSLPHPSGASTTPLSENRQIWAIAGPAIIANSSAPLVGLVDTWAIGHLPGAVYLAAVGVGATVFSYVFWAFGFMRMSTTGLVAQAHGRGDTDGLLKIVLRSLMLGGLIALSLIALQSLLFSASIAALAPPKEVAELYTDYFNIRIWSAPAVLFTYGISGYLIGVAKARAALVLQLVHWQVP
jgi:MATE family multidrug resistance protein